MTNIYLALFTTAHARLKLYSILEKLQEKVLYFDTDSVIYIDDGSIDIELGDFLGDLTNELNHDEYIEEFCATAPKSYAYKAISPNGWRTEAKVKGFSLTFDNSQKINLKSMLNLIENKNDHIKTKLTQIVRCKKSNFDLKTKKCKKIFSFNYDKRIIGEKYFTFPFGYL